CRRVTKSETEIRRRLKKCSRWPGFGVHDAPDLVFTMARIRRSRWLGKCNKGRDRFQLMAVRPRQQFFDIVLKACRRFACSHDNNKLKASSLTCLGTQTYNMCPDIRGAQQENPVSDQIHCP